MLLREAAGAEVDAAAVEEDAVAVVAAAADEGDCATANAVSAVFRACGLRTDDVTEPPSLTLGSLKVDILVGTEKQGEADSQRAEGLTGPPFSFFSGARSWVVARGCQECWGA